MPPAPGLANNTLRQIVHVSIGGKRIRLRFSNEFSNGPLTLRAVHVAVPDAGGKGKIQPQTDKQLTFNGGSQSVTIPACAAYISDPLDFDLAPLSDLAITIQFASVPSDLTGHPGSRTTSFLVPSGDALATPAAVEIVHWYVLSGVEVAASDNSSRAVVCLGDSITDGRGVTPDANRRWTDNLARRLRADKRTQNVAVLNMGIGGNRVLNAGLGPSALARFDRDVIAQSGVRALIILEGVNDIGTAPNEAQAETVQALIDAYTQMVSRAHAHNIRVYGATVTPFGGSFYDTPEREAARQKVNAFIRTSGVFDGIIDMDAALRDSTQPLRLRAAADSGDHLHPNDEGYRLMASAIPLDFFKP